MANKKVMAFEGLFGEIGAWLRTPLREAGIEFEWYPWWRSPEIPDGAILIGHSFGGAKVIKLANLYKPYFVITIDPRLPPDGGFKVKPFLVHNFYQTGFMKGFKVEGAVNFEVGGLRHTQMPRYPSIVETLKGKLKP